MKKTKQKIQHLLVKHLLENGEITLYLPDNMVINIGITQEGEDGDLHKVSDYCWLIAEQHNRIAALDSYNLGIRFQDDGNKFILEDKGMNEEGEETVHLDVV